VIDGFLPDVAAVRAHALAADYVDWPGYDGEVYKRVALTPVPGLLEAIQSVMGPVEMLGMGYRLNYAGELPNQAIHSDLGWGSHALVLYLCDGPGGTAFWRHSPTGATRIDPGDSALFERIGADWDDESRWEMTHIAPLKLNRAVIYESALFHSRHPFAAFGDCPDSGRLIAVAFFTPES
jgi:hypothetical protein